MINEIWSIQCLNGVFLKNVGKKMTDFLGQQI